MSTRPIRPEQGPTPHQRAAGVQAEGNRRLLRLFRASRPAEPSRAAWERSLRRIALALLAGCAPPGNARAVQALPAPVATGSVASIRREQS
jgi:hypothetical protein